VVHPLQELRLEVVWADRLRGHLRLARPQLVVAAATAEPTVQRVVPVASQQQSVAELQQMDPTAHEIETKRPCQHCWQGLFV
jgi:hypothetical protein